MQKKCINIQLFPYSEVEEYLTGVWNPKKKFSYFFMKKL